MTGTFGMTCANALPWHECYPFWQQAFIPFRNQNTLYVFSFVPFHFNLKISREVKKKKHFLNRAVGDTNSVSE